MGRCNQPNCGQYPDVCSRYGHRNPVQDARDALEGRIDPGVNTVTCDVCEREIPYHTARVIPGIGFMCPVGVEPKCSPQRTLADLLREEIAKERASKIESLETILYDLMDDDDMHDRDFRTDRVTKYANKINAFYESR